MGTKATLQGGGSKRHVSACCYWAKFAEYASRYAPYHKWLWTEFRKLGAIADKVSPLLEEGFEKVNLVDRIEMIYRPATWLFSNTQAHPTGQ